MVRQFRLGSIAVDVVLKDIKNIHLGVYPPMGRVRISAPKRMSLDTIRIFAISKETGNARSPSSGFGGVSALMFSSVTSKSSSAALFNRCFKLF